MSTFKKVSKIVWGDLKYPMVIVAMLAGCVFMGWALDSHPMVVALVVMTAAVTAWVYSVIDRLHDDDDHDTDTGPYGKPVK